VVLCLAHALAGLGLLPTALPFPLKLAVWLMLAFSLVRFLLRQGSVIALTLNADGRMSLKRRGDSVECRIDAATTVFPWLVVLRLRTGAGIESLALPIDALDGDGHRQLRTWLRWWASVESA
jgi:hypothetical protein